MRYTDHAETIVRFLPLLTSPFRDLFFPFLLRSEAELEGGEAASGDDDEGEEVEASVVALMGDLELEERKRLDLVDRKIVLSFLMIFVSLRRKVEGFRI